MSENTRTTIERNPESRSGNTSVEEGTGAVDKEKYKRLQTLMELKTDAERRLCEMDAKAGIDESKMRNDKTKAEHVRLRCLADVEEKEVSWLVPEYIPRGQIVLLGGDGGSGKTTLWNALAAAISNGEKVFFDKTPYDFAKGKPGKVIFFSSEDSVACVLKSRLKKAGANMENILFLGIEDDNFSKIKLNSPELKELIRRERPSLVIFDPIQGFIPENADMSKRNTMRNILSPLVGLGEETGTTFLIVIHTNKRSNVSGRNRIADSADLWDIARSVLIVGNVKNSDLHYISHEKSNYGMKGQTALFNIEDGKAILDSYTDKKDYDFVSERDETVVSGTSKVEKAKEFIMEFLKNGKKTSTELKEAAMKNGISERSLERARQEMTKAGLLKRWPEGFNPKTWYVGLIEGKN